jgi:hypothetical protein
MNLLLARLAKGLWFKRKNSGTCVALILPEELFDESRSHRRYRDCKNSTMASWSSFFSFSNC